MPVINKQSVKPPTTNNAPQRQRGSILSEAIRVNQIRDAPIKLLMYGGNRVGKTTLACLFPKPLLLVSFENIASGGATSVRKQDGVDFIHVDSVERGFALAQELESDTHYKTHVIDSCTSLQQIVLNGLLNRDVQLVYKGLVQDGQYVKRAEQSRDLLWSYLKLPVSTIVIGKEKDHTPQGEKNFTAKMVRPLRQESFVSVEMGGGTAGWLQDSCDYVVRLSVEKEVITKREKFTDDEGKESTITTEEETGDIVRRLRCRLHPNYFAGFRSDNPDAVPEYIDAKSPGVLYAKLLKAIKGEK